MNPIGAATSDAATLTVNKAVAAITLGALNFTYTGAPVSTTATTDPAGLTVVITYDGGAASPVNAGSYTVNATITDANYTGVATGTLVIAKAPAAVTLSQIPHFWSKTHKDSAAHARWRCHGRSYLHRWWSRLHYRPHKYMEGMSGS